MIGPHGAVRAMVATRPVDFRKDAKRLAALVRETMKTNPFSGAVYVFRAKRANGVKLIYWDGTGLCLFAWTTVVDNARTLPLLARITYPWTAENGMMRVPRGKAGCGKAARPDLAQKPNGCPIQSSPVAIWLRSGVKVRSMI
jgi:IS66 Orf2 like protein